MSDGFDPCWLVWESASDGGRPYLIAVDTSEEQARLHLRAARDRALIDGKIGHQATIEQSWLDHLYGESMTKGFDAARQVMRDVIRAERDDLRRRLREAIDLAREGLSLDGDPAERARRLDRLAQIERVLPARIHREDPDGR